MTQSFPIWPPGNPFPESQTETIPGQGPDFPDGAGGREQGKFRPSGTPRLTTLAVVDDDGKRIGWAIVPALDELIEEIRLLRKALMLQGTAADLGDL